MLYIGENIMREQLSVNFGNLILSLSEVPDLVNRRIAQHHHRTAYLALELSKTANLEPKLTKDIFIAALLHDIGAVTAEERLSLKSFDIYDESVHAIRGAVLIEEIPWLKQISDIIRYHHKRWDEWEESIEEVVVLASQIVLLADYVERLIDNNKYILNQVDDIIDIIKKLGDTVVHKDITAYFIELSKREEFWLDLTSPILQRLLQENGPFTCDHIGLEDISLISNLYRDIIDFKSRFTATHTAGVAECSVRMAELFGMAAVDVKSIRIAGNFHDIGKLAIPNSILEKPGKLTREEFAIIRSHTYYTYYIINSIGGMQRIAEWAAYHHEKLDGSGYPFHCNSDEISTGSRIVAVADIFTALAEDRPYRAEMGKNEIYQIFKEQTDKKLIDKRMVDLLFDNYENIFSSVKAKQNKAREFYEKRFLSIKNQSLK